MAMSIAVAILVCSPALGKNTPRIISRGLNGAKTSPMKPLALQARDGLIGNVMGENIYEGCGCYFQFPAELRARSNRHFFITDQQKRAWMNIAGKDIELQLTGADQVSLKSKKGGRMDFRFEAGDVHVRVRMLVTRTSTYDVDYEPARYAIAVQVTTGKRKQIIRTNGSCGC
jgi:hypothetical protein